MAGGCGRGGSNGSGSVQAQAAGWPATGRRTVISWVGSMLGYLARASNTRVAGGSTGSGKAYRGVRWLTILHRL